MEEEKRSKFVPCPHCGKRAILKVIKEKDFYLCPYCGQHGKVVGPEPVGEPRVDEEPIGDPEVPNPNPDTSDSPFIE